MFFKKIKKNQDSVSFFKYKNKQLNFSDTAQFYNSMYLTGGNENLLRKIIIPLIKQSFIDKKESIVYFTKNEAEIEIIQKLMKELSREIIIISMDEFNYQINPLSGDLDSMSANFIMCYNSFVNSRNKDEEIILENAFKILHKLKKNTMTNFIDFMLNINNAGDLLLDEYVGLYSEDWLCDFFSNIFDNNLIENYPSLKIFLKKLCNDYSFLNTFEKLPNFNFDTFFKTENTFILVDGNTDKVSEFVSDFYNKIILSKYMTSAFNRIREAENFDTIKKHNLYLSELNFLTKEIVLNGFTQGRCIKIGSHFFIDNISSIDSITGILNADYSFFDSFSTNMNNIFLFKDTSKKDFDFFMDKFKDSKYNEKDINNLILNENDVFFKMLDERRQTVSGVGQLFFNRKD